MPPYFQHCDPFVAVLCYITEVCLHGCARLLVYYFKSTWRAPKKCPTGTGIIAIQVAYDDDIQLTENVAYIDPSAFCG